RSGTDARADDPVPRRAVRRRASASPRRDPRPHRRPQPARLHADPRRPQSRRGAPRGGAAADGDGARRADRGWNAVDRARRSGSRVRLYRIVRMDQDPQPLLETRALVAGYERDINILNGVSVKAASGRIACIIGPNGTGKSTLLKTVFGILRP